MKLYNLLIILFFLVFKLNAQDDVVYKPFSTVEKSIVTIDENYVTQGLVPFIDSCANARVVYTGESHNYVEFNNVFTFAVLKQLNQTHNFMNHIIELGPARAAHLNKFLQGDSLAKLVLQATTSFKHFEFYNLLKAWNDTLPTNKRITIYGIDVERFNDIGVANLSLLLQKQKELAPKSIRQAVESIILKGSSILESGKYYYDLKSDDYSDVYSVNRSQTERIITDYETHKQEFKSYLNNDFQEFDKNIVYLKEFLIFKEYSGTPLEHNWRETNMFQRLQLLLDTLPNQKFYGQFGRCHSMLSTNGRQVCSWYNFKSTMERIVKNNPSIKTKTLGIFYGSSSIGDDEINNDIYKNAYAGRITLFNLHYKNQGNALPKLASEYDFVLNTQKLFDSKLKFNTKSKTQYYSIGFVYNPFFSVASMDNIYAQLNLGTINSKASTMGAYINFKSRKSLGFNYSLQLKINEHTNSATIGVDTFLNAKYRLNMQTLQPTLSLFQNSKHQLQIGAGLAILRNKINLMATKVYSTYQVQNKLSIKNFEINPIASLNYYYIHNKFLFLGAEAFYFVNAINVTDFIVKQNKVFKQTFKSSSQSIFQNTLNFQIKVGSYVY